MKIEGVIFDLDGTLLDSTWVWSQIDTDFLKKRGFEVPKDYSTAIMAMGFEEVAKYTIKRFLLQETKEDVMAEWDATEVREGCKGDTAEDSDAVAAVLTVVEGENDTGKPHHKGTKHEGDDDR